MTTERANAQASASASMRADVSMTERAQAHGRFFLNCVDINGKLIWEEEFDNVVTDAGARYLLDTGFAGSAFTVTGPFIGLISFTSFTAVSAADTMASHAGWLEAGNANTPTYTSPRKTAAWAASSGRSKSLSAALAFVATGNGTIKGCFMVLGSGAVSTIDNTSGTLYSAGTFTAGDQPVVNNNTVNVSWTGSA